MPRAFETNRICEFCSGCDDARECYVWCGACTFWNNRRHRGAGVRRPRRIQKIDCFHDALISSLVAEIHSRCWMHTSLRTSQVTATQNRLNGWAIGSFSWATNFSLLHAHVPTHKSLACTATIKHVPLEKVSMSSRLAPSLERFRGSR